MEPYNPIVSIILPTWNRADCLHIPIETCIDQTYSNWELWVMDDASTDNTQEVVEAYHDPRIHYVKLKKQPYYTFVRNKGITGSKGDLIAFRDSDGGWAPQFLEKLVRPHRNKDVSVTYCGRKDYMNVNLPELETEEISGLKPKLKTRPTAYTGPESLSDKLDVGDIVIKRSVFKDDFQGFSEKKDKSGYCSDAKLIDMIEKHNPDMKFVMVNNLLHYYFYKHGGAVENMTDTKIRYREEGNFDNELETKWDF